MQPARMEPKEFQPATKPNDAHEAKPHVNFWNSTWTIVIAFFVVGPLAMPLLWRNPRFSIATKIIWSLVMIAITVGLIVFASKVMNWALEQIAID